MSMKKYAIVLALAVSGLLVSCNEKLDLGTDGRIDRSEIFSDPYKVKGWVNSCYGYLPGLTNNRAAFTDEAHHADAGTSEGTNYYNYYNGNVTASNWPMSDGQVWTQLFQGIRKCNVFLTNIATADLPTVQQSDRQRWIAEVHTLRALYYWMLVKRYGGVPLFDTELGLDHDFSKDKRASYSECITFILDDCRAALAIPESSFAWIAEANAVTRGLTYAIMSEAVLYAASPKWSDGTYTWTQAAAITKEAVEACMNDGGYELYKTAPDPEVAQNAYTYLQLITPSQTRATDKETIYGFGTFAGRLTIWSHAGLHTTPRMTSAGTCPTQELVDAYEYVAADGKSYPVLDLEEPYKGGDHLQPNYNQAAIAAGYDKNDPYASLDPRFYGSIYYNGAQRNLDGTGSTVETFVGGADGMTLSLDRTYTRTGYYLRKFSNWQSNTDNNADGYIRMWRLAGLLLNYAEAANEAYGPDGGDGMTARQAINMVRDRAGMPDIDETDPDAFRLRCRNERRVELAFEEHRFFDVRRWGILEETDGVVTGMQIVKNGNNLTYNRVVVGNRACNRSKYYLYPILQSDVDKANNNTGVQWQNPGWEQ